MINQKQLDAAKRNLWDQRVEISAAQLRPALEAYEAAREYPDRNDIMLALQDAASEQTHLEHEELEEMADYVLSLLNKNS